jgi:hypothetical protein
VTFARLRTADWVAMLAAVALLVVMAVDWYSTVQGEGARRIERLSDDPAQGLGGEIERRINEDARFIAEGEERNAWQADAAIDRVILFTLLAAAVLAIGAGFLRAAGKQFSPPFSPSGLAGIAAALGALLVTYRILQEPGLDDASVVEIGAPLAVFILGVMALASRRALKHEEAGTQFRELPKKQEQPEPKAAAQ